MRLQKYMALCGAASRRAAEKMIEDGRVTLNGQTVTLMGVQVEEGDEVRLDGRLLKPEDEKVYIIFNKPRTVMTTLCDEGGRNCVGDYFKDLPQRVYPVGRLDYMTEGLLIVTNDGELTNRLTHPSHEVDKHYSALVTPFVTEEDAQKLRDGVMLDDGMTAPAAVTVHTSKDGRCVVAVTIHEGRNRQVRRMLESLGYTVEALRRTGVGKLGLGELTVGKWRKLTDEEVKYLKSL